MQSVNSRLIADIGASEGSDIAYYLRKGFQVVAVEADPVMYASLLQRFAREIADGSVVLLNRVAADTSGQAVQFWRNQVYQGLSTFDHEGAQFREHLVPCAGQTANWQDIVALRGVPYYCKIDIEGGEARFLRSMRGADARPTYVSAECHSFEPIEELFGLGYRRFKLVNQTLLSSLVRMLPNPALEGSYVADPDWMNASGPFGRELPDHWRSFQETAVLFDMIMRLKLFHAIAAPYWFDCHACRAE
jgi:FkbM family methyltransferase